MTGRGAGGPVRVGSRLLRGFLLLLALWGCRPGDGSESIGMGDAGGSLLVLGASDLLAAFEELVPLYERRTGEEVALVLGSTGNLSAQIRHGAPADLFFSANEAFLDDLIAEGRVDASSRSVYAVGRLALIVPPGDSLPAELGELADPRFRTVAIANPEHAPYGWAAREALRTSGTWEAVETRVVTGENVAHAFQFVRTGNADAGIVAFSLLHGGGGDPIPSRLVDDALHPPLVQVAGVVATSPRTERALEFLTFVLSEEGREILARYGFELPVAEVDERTGPDSPDRAVPSGPDGR